MSMRNRRLDVTAVTPGDLVVLDRTSYRVTGVTRDEEVILENVNTRETKVIDLEEIEESHARFRSNSVR